MSAFVVSTGHINAILNWANQQRDVIRFYIPGTDRRYYSSNQADDLTAIGELLLTENVRSVNHRYQEKCGQDAFGFRPNIHQHLKPIEVIKLCNCLRYQSCEHPEWEQSFANKVLDTIISYAIYKLPGYDKAPWTVDETIAA